MFKIYTSYKHLGSISIEMLRMYLICMFFLPVPYVFNMNLMTYKEKKVCYRYYMKFFIWLSPFLREIKTWYAWTLQMLKWAQMCFFRLMPFLPWKCDLYAYFYFLSWHEHFYWMWDEIASRQVLQFFGNLLAFFQSP